MSLRNTSAAPTGDACIIPKVQTFLGIAPFFSSLVVLKAKSRRKPVQPRMLDPETHWKVARRPPTNQRGNQPAIPCRKTRVGEAIDAGGGTPEPGAFRVESGAFPPKELGSQKKAVTNHMLVFPANQRSQGRMRLELGTD